MSAMQALSGPAEPGRTLPHAIAAAAQRWWSGYRDRRDRRSTVAILGGLSDAALKDIGLTRSELESLVNGPGEEHPRAYDRNWRARSA
jgi:uncharacterized protein YjiS (DUF1127 family)